METGHTTIAAHKLLRPHKALVSQKLAMSVTYEFREPSTQQSSYKIAKVFKVTTFTSKGNHPHFQPWLSQMKFIPPVYLGVRLNPSI